MSRRADVVRSNFTADPTTSRIRGGGCVILCHNSFGQTFESDSDSALSVGPIKVGADANYQRIFVSATLNGLRHNGGGEIIIAIYTASVGNITSIIARDGTACLTGVCDLPAGTHDVSARIYGPNAGDAGGGGFVDAVYLQVIIGQQVASQGCGGGGGGSGG